jgi:hypothetical protein
MAEVMEKKESAREALSVQPWGIEADHPRCCDLLLQSIPGERLRSTIIASKPARDVHSGMMMIPPDQSAFLAQFPPMPGMQLHVNPAKLTYTIIDPMFDDEDLCRKVQGALERQTSFRTSGKLRGQETKRGTLDVHRMKTLVREMTWLIDAGEARVVKGVKPDMEQIIQLPGEFLLNPGSRVTNLQPRFEKDWDAWIERLTASGG